ncbi:mitochondrial 54S ribosomal protein IMG2 [Sugiyamaella lignohabitans]|uniref:Large ribosomal subunit protein mL49 n=1 Tax=Sugiyamaella lignohabitans TaxID=796027 RepID=A0A167FG84_9ASCO|nr:mitochondrial 54S ribosomal protein IMG2 [Sugiyamaella lignohabitans]ANB15259.1 mitochondrial 54S ribosomal protein IMG2 [Sugiyamaella lignohabitans]
MFSPRVLRLLGQSQKCRHHSTGTLRAMTHIQKSSQLPHVEPGKPFEVSKVIGDSMFPSLDKVSASDLVLKKLSNDQGKAWYTITRTRSGLLPVYSDIKADGSVKTVIRRIEGDVSQLRNDIKLALGISKHDIYIKDTSKQIVIRGDYVSHVKQILQKAEF